MWTDPILVPNTAYGTLGMWTDPILVLNTAYGTLGIYMADPEQCQVRLKHHLLK